MVVTVLYGIVTFCAVLNRIYRFPPRPYHAITDSSNTDIWLPSYCIVLYRDF